eukprot:COSAG01_NODE_12340_length_1756_cov_4.010863_1_plen_184_part_01
MFTPFRARPAPKGSSMRRRTHASGNGGVSSGSSATGAGRQPCRYSTLVRSDGRAHVCKVAARKWILGLLLIMQAAHEAAGANCAAGANQTGCLVSDGARVCVAPGLQACKAPATEGSVTTVAGSSQGSANGIGAAAQFNGPAGVAISTDGTFALVADNGHHRIRRIVLASQAVTTLAGSSSGSA